MVLLIVIVSIQYITDMLDSRRKGYAVMNAVLTGIGFVDESFDNCKRYCFNGDVIVDAIPKKCGFSVCKKLNALQEEQHIFTDDEWLWLSSELGGMPTCEEELPPQND